MCYGAGGIDVTITDAHLILGRIPPHLLGGEVPLDVEAARHGLAALAHRLGLSVEACASGVLEVSAWNQANALRQITVKRGLDVRDFTLATFGGSGPLLLCRLLDILALRSALVPPNPGNVSAFGLLTVDVRNDYVRTAVCRQDELDPDAVEEIFRQLQAEAAGALSKEGFDPSEHRFARTADLRYRGQAFEVRVGVGGNDGNGVSGVSRESDDRTSASLDIAALDIVADRFHEAHRALYGYDLRGQPGQQVEWVNLRVSGIGPITRPALQEQPAGDADVSRARTGHRPVCFDPSAGYVDTDIFRRDHLRPGDVIAGPAIVEEYGSTVPIHPGCQLAVDAHLNLLVTVLS